MRAAVAVASLVVGVSGCPSLASTLPPGCTNATTISPGDIIRTSFGTNSCKENNGTYVDFYNLTVGSQTNLVLSLSSPGEATYVMVYDANHTPIMSSAVEKIPDTSATMRVMLGAASYPAGFQIAVRDTLGKQGAYRLSATPDTAPAAGCGLIWITTGITTSQRLTNADCTASSGGTTHYYHHYEIAMLFSQSNTFTDTSHAFSPSMTLFQASSGSSVTSTLDTTGTVATITAFAQAQDYYQLWVGTTAALQTGAYKLTVK